MAGFDNEVVYGSNVDFTGNTTVTGQVTLDGQLLIGSTLAPNIRVGTLTQGPGVLISNGPGSITLSVNGSSVGQTITGDVGGALSPTLGNWNILGGAVASGTNPVRSSGSVSTLTMQVQRSQAISSTNASNVGLAAFDSFRFSVDSNAFVTPSTQPYLQAFLNTPVSNVTGDSTIYDFVCDTVEIDTNSTYNTGTGVWTAPLNYSGTYLFDINICISNLTPIFNVAWVAIRYPTKTEIFTINPGTTYDADGRVSLSCKSMQFITGGTAITFSVIVKGGTKTVGIAGVEAGLLNGEYSWLKIKRFYG